MQILIIIGSVIAALIVLILVAGLLIKKEYSIQREIVIDRPVKTVFNYIRFLKNQDHYSKWVMTDPNMKKDFRGTDGQEGFVYAWNGNKKAGEGEQEILKINEDNDIDIEVRFVRPFSSIAKTPMRTIALNDNQTKVTWGSTATIPYPMNVMNLFIGGMLEKDLDISLQNLKRILENK